MLLLAYVPLRKAFPQEIKGQHREGSPGYAMLIYSKCLLLKQNERARKSEVWEMSLGTGRSPDLMVLAGCSPPA